MPYHSMDELPKAVREQYDEKQQRAFMSAFNSMFEDCDKPQSECERMAFRVGHMAALKVKENDQQKD